MHWLFTASTDGTVRIWDFPGLKCQKEFTSKASINSAVLHSNQTEIITADESGFIKVLDLIKGSFTIELVTQSYGVLSILNRTV
jgi:WD40 repeat protein